MQRHVAGQSIRQISREENRARETVTKIVRSDDMRTFVNTLRERFYGFGEHALDAVEYALVEQKDARLGYQLLTDIGVVPSPLERQPIRANEEVVKPESLNPWERALVGNEEGLKAQVMIRLARVAESRAEQFDLKLPTPDQLRHNRSVFHLIDEMTGGRGQELCFARGAEWKRLKDLAEERLQNLKGIEEKASVPRSEERQLEKGIIEDNVPEAAQDQQSQLAAGNAGDTVGNTITERSKSRST